MLGFIGAIFSGTKSGLAIGFPAGQNLVEGTEASMMVGGSAARTGWRKAWFAALAGLVLLMPFLAGLWFAYKYVPGEYIDYSIAVLIFGIGAHEIMEGLEAKPKRGRGRGRLGLEGPLGIDPADPQSITRFQAEHGLEEDGVLGPRTRGAILLELKRRGETGRPNRLGVDVADETSVQRFQRRLGLPVDGVVGPLTQGALAAESAWRLFDAADENATRRFQAEHGLPETGDVDERTQAALRALRAEHDTPRGDDGGPRSPYGVDLADGEAISRFQRGRGLPASGVVDRRTQGALRAEVERRLTGVLDPADAASIRSFQAEHGLEPTGCVDAATREALSAERDATAPTTAEQRTVLGLDPTDADSIERFQALHGLDRTGEIDEETRQELARVEEWTAGFDPADPESVRRFQRTQGLEPTGVVDAETQGAIQLRRKELERRHETDEDANADGSREWYPLDPADAESVARFQRERGLREDGRIGPRTQAALRAVTAERAQAAVAGAGEESGLKALFGGAWMAFVGTLLEGGEAGLFTISIGHSTGQWYTAAIAGGAGFVAPWIVLVGVRDWIASQPEWLVNLAIGIVLTTVATIFGLFHAVGLFGS